MGRNVGTISCEIRRGTVERESRNKMIRRLPSKSAPAVTQALDSILAEYSEPSNTFKISQQTMARNLASYQTKGKNRNRCLFFTPLRLLGAWV